MRKLSQRHRNFCLDVFKGLNQTQAYFKHFDCKSLEVARADAARLLTDDSIQQYLQKLHSKAEDSTIATVKERKEKLSEILRKSLPQQVRPRDMILAASELNKMDGIYQLPQTPEGGFSYTELTRAALQALKEAQDEGRVLSIETQRVMERVSARIAPRDTESRNKAPEMLNEGDSIIEEGETEE